MAIFFKDMDESTAGGKSFQSTTSFAAEGPFVFHAYGNFDGGKVITLLMKSVASDTEWQGVATVSGPAQIKVDADTGLLFEARVDNLNGPGQVTATSGMNS